MVIDDHSWPTSGQTWSRRPESIPNHANDKIMSFKSNNDSYFMIHIIWVTHIFYYDSSYMIHHYTSHDSSYMTHYYTFGLKLAPILLPHFYVYYCIRVWKIESSFTWSADAEMGQILDPPVFTNPPGVIFGSVLKWKNLHQELTLRSKLICAIPENHHYLNHTNLNQNKDENKLWFPGLTQINFNLEVSSW